MNISKRDIKFFVAGLIAAMIISFIWDWEKNIQDMKDGYSAGYNDARNIGSDE